MFKGLLPESPGANIKEFLVTIISEVKRPQTQCLSPKDEFWVCSETNCRMVRNSCQRAKGGLGKSMVTNELYDESIPFLFGILYVFDVSGDALYTLQAKPLILNEPTSRLEGASSLVSTL